MWLSYGGGGSFLSSLSPYITSIVIVYSCFLPVWALLKDKNQSDSTVCPAPGPASVGFYGMTGSSQEAVALCFMNFRNPLTWRQLILPYYVRWRVRTLDDFLRVQYMWVTIHLAPDGEALMGGKGVSFCTLSTVHPILTSILALEHLSTLKDKDYFPPFLSH